MTQLYMIGEFSKISDTSRRMLRYYDDMGLLKPYKIDDVNGYRYYHQQQLMMIKDINLLQSLGFKLEEIKAILEEKISQDELKKILRSKEATLYNDIDQKKTALDTIRKLINRLDYETSPKELKANLREKRGRKSMRNTLSVNINPLFSYLTAPEIFEEEVDLIGEQEGQVYYASLDLDRFMTVNDLNGYEVGDEVLRIFFNTILNEFKPLMDQNQCLISRVGGDECDILVWNTTQDEVAAHLKTILTKIAEMDFKVIGCTVPITTSIGLLVSESPSSYIALRHNSTKALLEAKRNGRNTLEILINKGH